MSFLAQAKKPKSSPPMIVLVGSPGAGKTSLAGMFPKPVFIQAEEAGTVFENWDEDVQPLMMPELPTPARNAQGQLVSTKDTLMAQLRELATADHDFETLVIDSISALNRLLEKEIALRDNVGNVADAAGGYHKGYIEVASWHAEIVSACQVVAKRKNMAVVFLSHIGVQKIKNSPTEASEYAVYSLDMHRGSAQVYVTNADSVVYIKQEEFITGAETNRKGQTTKFGRNMQTGQRVLITSGDGLIGYVDAKNRYGMDNEIPLPLGENPLLKYIKHFNKTNETNVNAE